MRKRDFLKLMVTTCVMLAVFTPVAPAAPQVVVYGSASEEEAVPEVGSFYQQDPLMTHTAPRATA